MNPRSRESNAPAACGKPDAGFRGDAARFGPLHEGPGSREGFLDWLSIFFISRGHYTLTDKGIREFGGAGGSRQERKSRAGAAIGELVSRGEAERAFREGLVARRAHLDWEEPAARIASVRALIAFLGKKPSELEFDDLRLYGLGGLSNRYRNSPYLALVEAGYAHPKTEAVEHSLEGVFDPSKLYPWELARAGNALYADEGVRKSAVGWLLWKTGKDARRITIEDFQENGLVGLLDGKYGGSPYRALAEAGFAYSREDAAAHAASMRFQEGKTYPWEMDNLRIYKDASMRSAATRWLIWKLAKPPARLTQDDFNSNGLGGLIQLPSYKGSPYAALVESGHAYAIEEALSHAASGDFESGRIYPWEMNNVRIYSGKRMRMAAVRWLVWRCGKPGRDLTAQDFADSGLGGVLTNHNEGSPFKALLEAGAVSPADEGYMRRRGAARFMETS